MRGLVRLGRGRCRCGGALLAAAGKGGCALEEGCHDLGRQVAGRAHQAVKDGAGGARRPAPAHPCRTPLRAASSNVPLGDDALHRLAQDRRSLRGTLMCAKGIPLGSAVAKRCERFKKIELERIVDFDERYRL